MPIRLNAHMQSIATTRTPLWVDAWAYGQRLLGNGQDAPWLDTSAFVAWHRQLQALVSSDVVLIEAGDFYRCWLQANPNLQAVMAQKRRLGYALRTLLADTSARNQLHEVITALCEGYQDRPVLLALPSPRQWIGWAYCQARQLDKIDVSWDDAESASMYVADFLRSFADSALSGLLIRDVAAAGPSCEAEVNRYLPVINVAGHYQWQLVLYGCSDDYIATPEQKITYCIHRQPGVPGGLHLADDCWHGERLPVPGGQDFWYATVPEDANPEQALETLSTLREEHRKPAT